jgi:oxalate decarboxylase/phosphoglucose isomerase-like protein (cupin superfamily)
LIDSGSSLQVCVKFRPSHFPISAVRRLLILGFLPAALSLITFAADAPDDRVKIDNEHARVLVVSSPAGAKSELHGHTMNRVMIYLDAGKMTLTDTAGALEMLNFKSGDALWSSATTRPHVSLNQSSQPVRIIEVELKSKPGGPTAFKSSELDWVKVDPKHCKIEIENDQVRVIRARYGRHEKGVMHEHALPYLVVFLGNGTLKVTAPDREPVVVECVAGQVAAGRPTKHVEENAGDTPLEVVVVEFRR